MNSTAAVVVAAAIDNAAKQNCPQRDFFNPVVTLSTQMFAILVMVQLFQLLLKLVGQPGPVAQILAGLVLGPTVLCRFGIVRNFFFQTVSADYYRTAALLLRQIIVFVMGLEADLPSLKRLSKPSIVIASSSALMSCILGAGIVPYVFEQFKDSVDNVWKLPFMFTVIIANTASPVVGRLVSDLKIASSSVGRLASCSALVNDTACLIAVCIVRMFIVDVRSFGKKFGSMLLAGALDAFCIFMFYLIAKYLNNTRRSSKYLTNTEVVLALVLIMMLAFFNESMGQNSLIPCFLAGALLPREGKTKRTLIRRLSYPVYVFLIPIYFGYLGFQVDFDRLFGDLRMIIVVVAIVLVSFGGKIGGTLLACRYLKMPLTEGVVLALLLNVKGFIDLLVLDMTIGSDNNIERVIQVYRLAMGVVVIDTLIAGVVAAIIVNIDKTTFGHRHTSLELQTTCSELRLLACVHHSRHVWTMVGLIAMMIGDGKSPILPNLTQLIELPKRTNNLTFHEQEDGGNSFSKGAADDYVGNDVVEINEAVDEFIAKTNITLQQSKIVSPVATLYEDVCSSSEDLQASMIIVSWHKHQRIDGQMEQNKKTGIRTTNQKILHHAPCSVGILVDKGGIFGGLDMPSSNTTQHVATLFFGGPDDREALAYSAIIGLHPNINLTVIRFIHGSSRECEIDVKTQEKDEVLMEITSPAKESLIDTTYLSDFFNRYVASGRIGFVERYVNNGAETLKVLKEMEDLYSLFLVGKGGREDSPITEGLSDLEECPELGKVGDFLASTEMDVRGSILVIQQHRDPPSESN